MALSMSRNQSIKFFGSNGVYSRSGGDFWATGIALANSLGRRAVGDCQFQACTTPAHEAVGELERAALLQPQNARFGYVLAVALHSAGKSDAAIATLKKILADHPNNRDVLEALASFYSGRGEGMKAKSTPTGSRR